MKESTVFQQIISGLKTGNSRTFNKLFEIYYGPLCCFSFKLIDDWQEAEAIATNTFQKVWMRRENFETFENLKAFLYITTKNESLNFTRSRELQKNRRQQLAEVMQEEFTEDPEKARIRNETLQTVYRQIEKLPKKCKQVFELRYFEDLNNDKIAAQLNISKNTVRNQIVRALKFLKNN